MISKELLSEVLEDKVIEILKCRDARTIRYYNREGNFEEINIHELAHKCKVHFTNKGYDIIIGQDCIHVYLNDVLVTYEKDLVFKPFDIEREFRAYKDL